MTDDAGPRGSGLRILMACAAFPPFIDGGGPISAMMVAKLLIAAGHDVEVVNVAGEDRREVFDGVKVTRLNSLNVDWNYRLPRAAWKKALWHGLENFNPRAFFVMRREMKRLKPDLVLTDSIENVNVATWAAAKSLGLPTVHILRSAFLICWKASMRKGDGNCGRACSSCQASSYGKKLTSRFVDAVVGETAFIVDRHLDHGYFPNASAHVVPGAIAGIVATAPRAAPVGRSVRFGFIGVLDPVKGLDTLAAAANRLEPDAGAEFLIAGAGFGPYADSLPAKFPTDTTRFLGWTKPETFFPKIDVLVVPSLFREPFGRVAIEAFAHGVPVVAARSGGLPETIEPGVNGEIFTPGHDAELAGVMTAIARDPDVVARLSEGALRSAEKYLAPRVAAGFDAVFASLGLAPAASHPPETDPFFTAPRQGEAARRSRAGEAELGSPEKATPPHPALRADLSAAQVGSSRLEHAKVAKSEASDFAGRGRDPRSTSIAAAPARVPEEARA